MADADVDLLKVAENKVSQFICGGPCAINPHLETSKLEHLVMWRQLKLLYPHEASNIVDLEISIKRELRKMKG